MCLMPTIRMETDSLTLKNSLLLYADQQSIQ